jgi:hypothetical protein
MPAASEARLETPPAVGAVRQASRRGGGGRRRRGKGSRRQPMSLEGRELLLVMTPRRGELLPAMTTPGVRAPDGGHGKQRSPGDPLCFASGLLEKGIYGCPAVPLCAT